MKLPGKWACLALYDCSMDITDDGSIYLSLEERGDYNLRPEFTMTDNGLCWKTADITCTLTFASDDTLTGTFTEGDNKPKTVEFTRFPGTPVGGKAHHHDYGAPETVPADFPLTAVQLHGKWSSPVPYSCDMNIFAEGDKITLFLSFGVSQAWSPIDVYFDNGTLVWQINDANNRGRCTLRPADGKLTGTYTQLRHGAFDPADFIKVSDTPEKNEPPVALPDNKSRIELLRENAAYGEPQEPVETEFKLNEPAPAILENYGYSSYLEGKSGDDIAFACLNFVCDNFHHYGNSGMPSWKTRRVEDFIKYCTEHDNKTNCRGLSIMLAGILRFNGIRAQHVTCMPYEDPFNDCHVVVDCFLPSGKRIMLDPTYRLWLYDNSGETVSLPRLRQILIEGGELRPCPIASYTGGEGFDIDNYREYMSKNTLRFSKGRINADGNDEYEELLLFPAYYPWEKVSRQNNAAVLSDPKAFWGEGE